MIQSCTRRGQTQKDVSQQHAGSRSGENLTLPKAAQKTVGFTPNLHITQAVVGQALPDNVCTQTFPSPLRGKMSKGQMRGYLQGFTLIELLVAIMIIGILAAVAVPQYQKAVLKSRYSGMMPIAKALAEANEVFYLEHGEYSENPADLLVAGRDKNAGAYPDGTRVLMYDEDGLSYVRVMNDNVPNARYLVYQKHSENFPDTTQCEAADDRANELCVALGGQLIEDGNSSGETEWTAYVLSGRYGSGDQFAVDPGDDTGDDEGGDNNAPQTPACDLPTDEELATMQSTAQTNSGNQNLTVSAQCINGKLKYEWSGGRVYRETYQGCAGYSTYQCAGSTFSGSSSQCFGEIANGCTDSTFSGQTSLCKANAASGCIDSTFSGYQSKCDTGSVNGCAGSTFSGYQSECYADGDAVNGCANSTFSGLESECNGRAANACTGSTFSGQRASCSALVAGACADTTIQAGAYCSPGVSGGCDGAKYGEDPTGQSTGIGSCNGDCPDGVPLNRLEWNYTTKSYDISGWKGGYCDATAMASGVCPNGSPTGSDKTTAAGWNGGYCTKAMYGRNCPAGSPAGDDNGAIAGKCWNGNGGTKACS